MYHSTFLKTTKTSNFINKQVSAATLLHALNISPHNLKTFPTVKNDPPTDKLTAFESPLCKTAGDADYHRKGNEFCFIIKTLIEQFSNDCRK